VVAGRDRRREGRGLDKSNVTRNIEDVSNDRWRPFFRYIGYHSRKTMAAFWENDLTDRRLSQEDFSEGDVSEAELRQMTSGRVRRFGLMNRLEAMIGKDEALNVVMALPSREGTLSAARVSTVLLQSGLAPKLIIRLVTEVHVETMRET